jgi:hypothetical protein
MQAVRREAARAAALAAKAELGSRLGQAISRKDYESVAAAYAAAAAAASDAGLLAEADGDILGVFWCSEAYALLRTGDYEKAELLCADALGCALPAKVRDKAEKRLHTAETGLQLLRGPVEHVLVAGSALEDAVSNDEPEVVARLIKSMDFMEARCIIECRSLVHKAAMRGFVDCVQLLVEEGGGDVEATSRACRWAAPRHGRSAGGRVATSTVLRSALPPPRNRIPLPRGHGLPSTCSSTAQTPSPPLKTRSSPHLRRRVGTTRTRS